MGDDGGRACCKLKRAAGRCEMTGGAWAQSAKSTRTEGETALFAATQQMARHARTQRERIELNLGSASMSRPQEEESNKVAS